MVRLRRMIDYSVLTGVRHPDDYLVFEVDVLTVVRDVSGENALLIEMNLNEAACL